MANKTQRRRSSHSEFAGLYVTISSSKQIPHDEIRGLKVVMPKDFRVEFFGEGGQISQVTAGHGLVEVSVGGVSHGPTFVMKKLD